MVILRRQLDHLRRPALGTSVGWPRRNVGPRDDALGRLLWVRVWAGIRVRVRVKVRSED